MEAERLWKQFNLTPTEAAQIFIYQEGKCAICGKQLQVDSPATCGDHNHRDGIFRAWLCFLCNRALGLFGDDVERLRAAVRYLENTPPAVVAIGKRYGTVGRKAGKLPKARKHFFRRSTEVFLGVVYRCGCSDSGPRPPKACPIHKQPKKVLQDAEQRTA